MTNKKLSLAYHLSGAQDRPVILFLHGFMGRGDDWKEIVSRLSIEFRCFTIDLPGHGQTASLNFHLNWRMENTAGAIISLLKKLNIAQTYIVGYSLGGRLALYLALQYPLFFPKVILESASPGLKSEFERKERIARDHLLAGQLGKGDFQTFLNNWYRQPLFQTLSDHAQFKKMLQRRLKNNPEALAKSLREMGTGCQPSLWEKLSQNKIPLLLVVGEKDAKFRAIAGEMAKICPAARVTTISGCSHNVHFEAPKAFVQQLESFLSS